jgi:hypothetical protein
MGGIIVAKEHKRSRTFLDSRGVVQRWKELDRGITEGGNARDPLTVAPTLECVLKQVQASYHVRQLVRLKRFPVQTFYVLQRVE